MTTIKTAIENYLTEINASDKAKTTKYTFGNCLSIMQTHFGDDKEVKNILPVHMAGYFKSEGVMGTTDKPKAKPTVDQIKRIARQFLVWAQGQGYIEKLPLPKEEMEIEKRKAEAKVRKETAEAKRSERKEKKAKEPKVKKEKPQKAKWVAEPDKPKVEDVGVGKEWVIGGPKAETTEPAEPSAPTQTETSDKPSE